MARQKEVTAEQNPQLRGDGSKQSPITLEVILHAIVTQPHDQGMALAVAPSEEPQYAHKKGHVSRAICHN